MSPQPISPGQQCPTVGRSGGRNQAATATARRTVLWRVLRRASFAVAAGSALVLAACTSTTVAPSVATDSPAAGLHPVAVGAAVGASSGAAAGRRLDLPAGWKAEVWADVESARMLAWTSDGHLLVTTDQRGDVEALTPNADAGRAPAVSTVAQGLDRPQGIATATLGGVEYVVVGEQTRIVRYRWVSGALRDRTVLADGLPGGGLHYGKFLAVQGDAVTFNIGTSTDDDPADRTGIPERGTIERVPLLGGRASQVAQGVRNAEGLSFAPDGSLFAAVNQVNDPAYPYHRSVDGIADAFGRTGTSWTDDNPVDQITRVTVGSDLGWPYCVPIGLGAAPTILGYVDDAANNIGGSRLKCSALPSVQVGLPGHSAPIGFHFLTGSSLPASLRRAAVVVTHGSFQRNPPRAPGIWTMEWNSGSATLGRVVPFASGWQVDGGRRWGRPVDAVPSPSGDLIVSDDQAGLVYRLIPPAGG